MGEISTGERRNVLKGVAALAVAGAGTVGLIGAAGGLEGISQNDSQPKEYFQGTVAISKGVKIRTSAEIPHGSDTPPNEKGWENVVLPDGKSLSNITNFEIRNPLVVNGENPNGGTDPSPWITFKDKDGSTLHISLSPQTFNFVKTEPGGHFVKGHLDEGGNFDTDIGSEIPSIELGQVILPQTPYNP